MNQCRSGRWLALAAGLMALPAMADDLLTQGREVFTRQASPSCTLCHTLADAGASGNIGPDLDQLRPAEERVIQAVTGGVGIMPPFAGSLSPEQIRAVAHYVATVTGAGTPAQSAPGEESMPVSPSP